MLCSLLYKIISTKLLLFYTKLSFIYIRSSAAAECVDHILSGDLLKAAAAVKVWQIIPINAAAASEMPLDCSFGCLRLSKAKSGVGFGVLITNSMAS